MGLMDGKRGVVFGIANDRSYAWYITKQLVAHGATCCFSHLPGDRVANRCRVALAELGVDDPWLMPCDVSNDEDFDALFAKLEADFGTIDFVVHSVAFADRQFLKPGTFKDTTRAAFTQALDISVYSLLAMAQRAAPLMPDGGSIISMSYQGGERVVPGYNVMGVAKAALEHTTRYLAADLGEKKIRVNCISGGPLRTLAAMAVAGIGFMFEKHAQRSPLKRNIEGEEVGNTAVYLLSDMASGITGEIVHVDCGFNVLGV